MTYPAPAPPTPAKVPLLARVLANREIAHTIWQLDLEWDETPVQAGQFLNILPAPGGAFPLRRPLSIADINADNTVITVIYRVVGKGTAVLSQTPVGASVDVLGPLGCGFPIPAPQSGRALLSGGGVGIPPLHLLGKRLRDHGWEVTFHLGLRTATEVFWEDKFRALGDVEIATDDGTAGRRGTVMDLPVPGADTGGVGPALVGACGPLPMLRAIKERWQGEVATFISLEERMACGTGACYACVVADANDPDHQYRACYDGPVFPAQEVLL